jgi:hypothetical protein
MIQIMSSPVPTGNRAETSAYRDATDREVVPLTSAPIRRWIGPRWVSVSGVGFRAPQRSEKSKKTLFPRFVPVQHFRDFIVTPDVTHGLRQFSLVVSHSSICACSEQYLDYVSVTTGSSHDQRRLPPPFIASTSAPAAIKARTIAACP